MSALPSQTGSSHRAGYIMGTMATDLFPTTRLSGSQGSPLAFAIARTPRRGIPAQIDSRLSSYDSDPDDFAPIFWEGPGGEVIATDWACGFPDAVALRPLAWGPVIEDDRAGILMAPLFLPDGDMELAVSAADEHELLAEASDMIPTCVARIREFWENNGSHCKPRSSRGRSRPGHRTRH